MTAPLSREVRAWMAVVMFSWPGLMVRCEAILSAAILDDRTIIY